MGDKFRVSVLVPTRNRSEKLARAIESAVNAIRSAGPVIDAEIIVSDNASTDGTSSVIRQAQSQHANLVRSVRSEVDVGMVGNWVRALDQARGDWLILLCDDDWLSADFFERARSFIEAHPSVGLVAFERTEIGLNGETTAIHASKTFPTSSEVITETELLRFFVSHENILGPPSAVLFSRKALEVARGRGEVFSKQFQYAADWAGWMALANGQNIGLAHLSLVNIEMHEENLTKEAVDQGVDLIEVSTLRWIALARLSRLTGSNASLEMRLRLSIAYRLARRFFKLLFAGRPFDIFSIARRLAHTRQEGQSLA